MIYSVIMAGGKGTRFWPLSRENRPKQLLSIAEEKTMIQATLERIAPLSPPERVLIITGAQLAQAIAEQLPSIPKENIIAEPAGRNTAPCVALAAAIIHKRSPGAMMAVFPADHVVTNPARLRETVAALAEALEKEPDKLATIGITPSYPETGYGYIKAGEILNGPVRRAEGFAEKPDIATAKKYLECGGYFWNSGMFFWKTAAILSAIQKHAPALYEGIQPLAFCADTPDFYPAMEKIYPGLPSISIDYAVMEKAAGGGLALVAAVDPGWSDVGSWRSLYDLIPPDKDGNRVHGDLVSVNSTGLLVHGSKRLVAAVGVQDLIVVETADAILICAKEQAQEVRQVIEKLNKLGKKELL